MMRYSQQSVFGLTEVCPRNTDLTFKCLMTLILLKNEKNMNHSLIYLDFFIIFLAYPVYKP